MPAAEKLPILAVFTMLMAGTITAGVVKSMVTVEDAVTVDPFEPVAFTVPTFVIEPAVTSAAVVV